MLSVKDRIKNYERLLNKSNMKKDNVNISKENVKKRVYNIESCVVEDKLKKKEIGENKYCKFEEESANIDINVVNSIEIEKQTNVENMNSVSGNISQGKNFRKKKNKVRRKTVELEEENYSINM